MTGRSLSTRPPSRNRPPGVFAWRIRGAHLREASANYGAPAKPRGAYRVPAGATCERIRGGAGHVAWGQAAAQRSPGMHLARPLNRSSRFAGSHASPLRLPAIQM
jgi:hypothetical protein